MRILTIVIAITAAVAGCTTRDAEGVCCVSDADCARLGVDEPRPCEAGQACRAFACVAAECTTSADCASPGAPVCVDSLCVAACRADADCTGAAGPFCASDGSCVGCLSADQCQASAPFCDAEDRSCRGCEQDAECASGVCLEMDAICAAEAEVVFINPSGQDVGECLKAAPCKTLQFALTKVFFPGRLVVHIAGGNFAVADTTVALPVYFDGTNTVINGDGTGPYFRASAIAGPVTLANVMIAPGSGPAATADANAALRIYNASITEGVETTGGTIIAKRSAFAGLGLKCTAGTLIADECRFTTDVGSTSCQLTVSANVFDVNGGSALFATSGRVTLENNLITQSDELADTVVLINSALGSSVRFNTIVNMSTVASDGVALHCDSTLEVTSNVFAYRSMHPHGTSTCASKYSLYDTTALPEQTDGTGNRIANDATIFANRNARDFHLAPDSAARGTAQVGTGVLRDLEGRARPDPIGSAPDMGAFEAP